MISFAGIASLAKLAARLKPLIGAAKWLPVTGPLGAAVVPIAAAIAEGIAAMIRIVVEGVTKMLAHPATLSVLVIAIAYGWFQGAAQERQDRAPLEAALKQCRADLAKLKPAAKKVTPQFKWGF